MVTKLLVPDRRIVVPKPPSYVKLDMAFGIGAGTQLMDKSRYRSHGTISGADWAAGLHGYALDFVSTTPSYVEIPAAYTQLDFTTEDFSIIMRVYPDSLAGSPVLFIRGKYNDDGYYLSVGAGGAVAFYTSQASAAQASATASGAVVTGSWFTIGISRDGASVKPYINGVVDTTTEGAHINPLTAARGAILGVYFNKTGNPFDGKIEFLRVFGGIALSASEQLAWHNALA